MCGRFTLFTDIEEIKERFDIQGSFDEEYQFSYNIAPSQSVLSVINDGVRNRLGYLRWGLIPFWAKDEKAGYKMINARAETIAEKASFRNAYKKKRCLIIADSFYEWKKTPERKIPMRIKLKNHAPFGMAGLWESWKSPEGISIYSCSVITTVPNELMTSIHDRMPVILKPEDEKDWLNPSINDPAYLQQYLKSFDSEQMEAFEVSTDVNSTKNNSPNLIQQIC
ncbi:SOS response-associated peptidase [Peribacillus castrilensis]|jgi:putative SOS response-associated peptidase YedK|uniref:SOS response-associated peptidase n=1 Tax=Peribacillus TaxID=2675229 RepID=UPI0007BEAA2A|nr:SOS response-associated peptidase [Peribacillus frigoritolerans]PEO44957.1 SOS response-associated peptidase [Bacillus sp. AFS026049]MCR8869036.1 SOS response-associated peptidase [Peribacillus frigoritolerans]MDF2000311.1 SOS response-associated peptidase [Peribacillus frigoritolerans]MEB2492747.1 SOS response-associated peptidase [Peribacillus frigoritolerans]MED3891629.1 SOS response-associated peptidase [Peribacillus frigoritolerans]